MLTIEHLSYSLPATSPSWFKTFKHSISLSQLKQFHLLFSRKNKRSAYKKPQPTSAGTTGITQRRCLFDDIHLSIAAGETVAILGASGSGKSSLLNIIAGLESPTQGRVLWQGIDLAHTPAHRRGFAMLFQQFALFNHLSVVDNVAFGLIEQGVNTALARDQATILLGEFGLKHTHQTVWTLSGGEQQRVALARALITHPKVLLLDEPFSALDSDLRLQLRSEFSQRIQAAGIATVLVTHDEIEAKAMAQSAWRLQGGRLHKLW